MGKRKAIIDYKEYKRKLRKCPQVKVRCIRGDRYSGMTQGKIYNVENDLPDVFMVLNDRKEMVRIIKRDFEILFEGKPVENESQNRETQVSN